MKTALAGVDFEIPIRNGIPPEFQQYIHAEWIDRIPLKIYVGYGKDRLQLQHEYKESLRIIVPWEIEGLGVFFLKTVSLPRREEPYHLALELARGTVGRLVDQTEDWMTLGLTYSDEVRRGIDGAKRHLRLATFSSGETRSKHAELAIGNSVQLMNDAAAEYSNFIFNLRQHEDQKSKSLLGAFFDTSDPKLQSKFEATFNTAMIPVPMKAVFNSGSREEIRQKIVDTRQILEQVCRRFHKLNMTTLTAPLIRMGDLHRDEFESLDDAVEKIYQVAARSQDLGSQDCKLFYPLSELGCCEEGNWNEQEQIHITHNLLSRLKSDRPSRPLILGFQQPFGEPLIRTGNRSHSTQLADQLVRQESPVAAFCLEFNVGYYPNGTWTRDLFAFNDLLDSWGQFDYPLLIHLRVPGGDTEANTEFGERRMIATLDSQASWVRHLTELVLAKANVAGVIYGSFKDRPSEEYLGSGLISENGLLKPAFGEFAKIRDHLRGSSR